MGKPKKYLIEQKGLEDKPETWTFILSQLQGIKQPLLRGDMRELVAYYKRWKIAAVLQAEKLVYIQELNAKLEALARAQVEAKDDGTTPPQPDTGSDVLGGTSHTEGLLPPLPEPKKDVVSTPSW